MSELVERKAERKPLRSLQRAVKRLAFAAVLSVPSELRHPPGGIPCVEKDYQPGGKKARSPSSNLRSLTIDNGTLCDTLKINRMCVSSSIEHSETSDTIRVHFEDGSSLNIKLKAGSIRGMYVRRTNSYDAPSPVVIDDFAEIMRNSKVVEVSSSANGKESKNFSSYDELDNGQQLVFTRSDGTELVVELLPQAIKSIEFNKG